jgi:hypothetical protein
MDLVLNSCSPASGVYYGSSKRLVVQVTLSKPKLTVVSLIRRKSQCFGVCTENVIVAHLMCKGCGPHSLYVAHAELLSVPGTAAIEDVGGGTILSAMTHDARGSLVDLDLIRASAQQAR